MNENTKFLLEEIQEEKAYDSISITINMDKATQERIYLISEELEINYDDAACLLIKIGSQNIYNK